MIWDLREGFYSKFKQKHYKIKLVVEVKERIGMLSLFDLKIPRKAYIIDICAYFFCSILSK